MSEDTRHFIWCLIHAVLSVATGGLYFYILLIVWYLKEDA